MCDGIGYLYLYFHSYFCLYLYFHSYFCLYLYFHSYLCHYLYLELLSWRAVTRVGVCGSGPSPLDPLRRAAIRPPRCQVPGNSSYCGCVPRLFVIVFFTHIYLCICVWHCSADELSSGWVCAAWPAWAVSAGLPGDPSHPAQAQAPLKPHAGHQFGFDRQPTPSFGIWRGGFKVIACDFQRPRGFYLVLKED